VEVTIHQGGWESHPKGEGAQVVRPKPPCGTRDAESQNGAKCHLPILRDKIDRWRAK
jgi:hypothetical protein